MKSYPEFSAWLLEQEGATFQELQRWEPALQAQVQAFEELLTEHFLGKSENDIISDEETVARLAEQPHLLAGVRNVSLGQIASMRAILQTMVSTPDSPVPEVLKTVVNRALETKAKPTVPAFIVRLVNDGVQVVKSSLQGLAGMPEPSMEVRSGNIQSQRQELAHTIAGMDGLQLRYSLIREAENELMLSVRLENRRIGKYNAHLFREGQVVASRTLANPEYAASMRHLRFGDYELRLDGPVAVSVPFQVQG